MEADKERPSGSPPFWEQPVTRRRDSRLWVFAAFLVLIISFAYFYLPPFFAFAARILRPNHIRKSWDSLNLFLVLFAIVFGFLNRNQGGNGGSGEVAYAAATPTAVGNNGGFEESTPRSESWRRSPVIEIPKWFQQYNYGYGYNVMQTTEGMDDSVGSGRLRRSSSSYPDLRQEEDWATESRRRFHDDTEVAPRRRSGHRRRQHGNLNEVNDSKPTGTESITSDFSTATAAVTTESPPEDHKTAEDPLPQVPDVSPQRSRLRESSSYPDLRQEEVKRSKNGRLSWDDSEVSTNRRSKHRRHHRRRSYGGDFFGDRDVPTIFDDKLVLHQTGSIALPPSSSPQLPKPKSTHKFEALSRVAKSKSESYVREAKKKPPPPPPPPPPPRPRFDQKKSDKKRTRGAAKDIATVLASFYNQKKHKNRITSSSSISDEVPNAASYPPPPPPPPPPPTSVFHNWFSQKKVLKTKKSLAVKTSAPPPRNVAPGPEFSRSGHFDHLMAEDYLSSGGQSPLVPVAPPPPPFQMKDMRFKLKGDFVRVRSLLGDVSHSEAGDISDTEFAEERNVSMFCQSPSVDSKADTFIARFRAGLKLEKLNSLRQKEAGSGSVPS